MRRFGGVRWSEAEHGEEWRSEAGSGGVWRREAKCG